MSNVLFLIESAETEIKKGVLDVLRPFHITFEQYKVLDAVNGSGGISVKEISAKTNIKAPSISRILRELEKREFVTVTVSESDQRNKIVKATRTGSGLARKLKKRVNIEINSEEVQERTKALAEALKLKLAS